MSKAVEIMNTAITDTTTANTVETTECIEDKIFIDTVADKSCDTDLHKEMENIHITHRAIIGKNTTKIARITKTPAPVRNRLMLP